MLGLSIDVLRETRLFLDKHFLSEDELQDSEYLESLLYNFLEYYDTILTENHFSLVIKDYNEYIQLKKLK